MDNSINNVPNTGVQFGHSSRLGYDNCYHQERVRESTGPMQYRLNTNQISNCSRCLSTFGPRSSRMCNDISTAPTHSVAPAQDLVDVESILTNRNVLQSKCRDGRVNHFDMSKYTVQHARECDHFLDPVSSRLTNPPQTYRGLSVNRFYDLPKNPQANIFWNFAANTKLEAKDNFVPVIPKMMDPYASLPKELEGKNEACVYKCAKRCSGYDN